MSAIFQVKSSISIHTIDRKQQVPRVTQKNENLSRSVKVKLLPEFPLSLFGFSSKASSANQGLFKQCTESFFLLFCGSNEKSLLLSLLFFHKSETFLYLIVMHYNFYDMCNRINYLRFLSQNFEISTWKRIFSFFELHFYSSLE